VESWGLYCFQDVVGGKPLKTFVALLGALRMLVRREFEDIGDLRVKVRTLRFAVTARWQVAEALVLWETYAPPSEHVMVSSFVLVSALVNV
jgi:hypothetical protein